MRFLDFVFRFGCVIFIFEEVLCSGFFFFVWLCFMYFVGCSLGFYFSGGGLVE